MKQYIKKLGAAVLYSIFCLAPAFPVEPLAITAGAASTAFTTFSAAMTCASARPGGEAFLCLGGHTAVMISVTISLAKNIQDVKPLALTHVPGEDIHPLLNTVALELLDILEEQGFERLTSENAITLISNTQF